MKKSLQTENILKVSSTAAAQAQVTHSAGKAQAIRGQANNLCLTATAVAWAAAAIFVAGRAHTHMIKIGRERRDLEQSGVLILDREPK